MYTQVAEAVEGIGSEGDDATGPAVDQAHREEQETQLAFDLERLAEEEAQRGREQEEEQQRQTLYASLERASPAPLAPRAAPPPAPPCASDQGDHFDSAEEEEADFASAEEDAPKTEDSRSEEDDAPVAVESRAAATPPRMLDVDEPAAARTLAAEHGLEESDGGAGFMACRSCESGGLDKPPR